MAKSETAAVKRAVATLKHTFLRSSVMIPKGKGKKFPAMSGGRSVNLGWVGRSMLADGGQVWGRGARALNNRLKKRIGKKLGQPFRRKKRGPKHRRAAGKNNVRPSRGMRR